MSDCGHNRRFIHWEDHSRPVQCCRCEIARLGRCNEQLSLTHAEQINHQNAMIARLRAALTELHCAVWECPPDEFEEALHADTVAEAHRVNKSEATFRELLATACDAWERGLHPRHNSGVLLADFRCPVLSKTWYAAARQACGTDEGGEPNG